LKKVEKHCCIGCKSLVSYQNFGMRIKVEDVKERFDFEKIYTDFESYDDVEAFGSKTKIE